MFLFLEHKLLPPESMLPSKIQLELALARTIMTSLLSNEVGFLFIKGTALFCDLCVGDKVPNICLLG